MKKFFKAALLGIISLIPVVVHAIAREEAVFINTENGNVLVCLYDIHFDLKNGKATKKQRANFIKIAKKFGAHIITEDLLTIPAETLRELGISREKIAHMQSLYKTTREHTQPAHESIKLQDAHIMDDESTINSPKQKWHDAYYYSPLCTTETIARKNNLSVYNAEMRHAYYLSEETNSKISVQDLMEIDQGSIASCAYVQDISPNLRQWYTATVERYNTNDATRLLKAMAQKNPSCTIADVQKSEQVQQLATKLSLYNWELLNLTMLHDLYRNKNKKIILMYMGADHIDAIEPLLSDFNYKEIARIGSKPLIDEDDPTGGKIIPVVNIEQLPTLLAEHNLFSTSLAADYLIPVYRTITTGQFPLSSFVTVA